LADLSSPELLNRLLVPRRAGRLEKADEKFTGVDSIRLSDIDIERMTAVDPRVSIADTRPPSDQIERSSIG